MTYSSEKAAAYEQMEAAIEALNKAFNSFSDGTMPTGWLFIETGIRFATNEDDYDESHDDELDATSVYIYHSKRGQDPTLSRGMVEAFLDKFRQDN